MTNILLLDEITETLYVTNLKLSLPPKSIAINPQDLLDDALAIAWGTDGARVSFSLPINERVSKFNDKFTNMRREIVAPLMFTGYEFLLYESSLNEYLEKCRVLDNEFLNDLTEILSDWDDIREDFEGKLFEKVYVAIRAKNKDMDNGAIDEKVKIAVENYMNSKFPLMESLQDKCGVSYETPRVFKSVQPANLSENARLAWQQSQTQSTKMIHELLLRDYDRIELDFVVGFLNRILDNAKDLPFIIFQQQLKDYIYGSDDGEIVYFENVVNSNGKKRYSIKTYQNLTVDVDNLLSNVKNSLPTLKQVVTSEELDIMEEIKDNLICFLDWLNDYINEYQSKKSQD